MYSMISELISVSKEVPHPHPHPSPPPSPCEIKLLNSYLSSIILQLAGIPAS